MKTLKDKLISFKFIELLEELVMFLQYYEIEVTREGSNTIKTGHPIKKIIAYVLFIIIIECPYINKTKQI